VKTINAIMALLFLLSAALQINDPDPLAWILVYSAAAMICVLFHLSRLDWRTATAIALVAALWLGFIFPQMIENLGESSLAEILDFSHMKTLGTELIREVGGLLIVIAWMTALASKAYRNVRQDVF